MRIVVWMKLGHFGAFFKLNRILKLLLPIAAIAYAAVATQEGDWGDVARAIIPIAILSKLPVEGRDKIRSQEAAIIGELRARKIDAPEASRRIRALIEEAQKPEPETNETPQTTDHIPTEQPMTPIHQLPEGGLMKKKLIAREWLFFLFLWPPAVLAIAIGKLTKLNFETLLLSLVPYVLVMLVRSAWWAIKTIGEKEERHDS